MRARHQIDRQLGSCGYTLLASGGLRRIREVRLHRISSPPAGYGYLRTEPTRRFLVELDRITTPSGFSYHPGGWHPYRATLAEYLVEPGLPYEHSTLHAYYERFQPRTVQDALLEDEPEPLPPLSTWPVQLLRDPIGQREGDLWHLTRREVARVLARAELAKGPRQHFGPQPRLRGYQHLRRLLDTHESLRRDGYQPDAFPDGDLTGYFLVRGDEYRFVVFQGNHRLAAMRELGIDRLTARLHPGHPPVVHERELERWTTAKGGLLPPAVAARLFDKLFTERGDEKARNLGLLPA